MDLLILDKDQPFDVFKSQFLEGSMNLELNPHLTSIYIFFFLFDKYGVGEIKYQHRNMFYPAVYAEIVCGNPLPPHGKEWLYLYIYSKEIVRLHYLRTWKADDYPYRDPEHVTYTKWVTLESFINEKSIRIESEGFKGYLPARDQMYIEWTMRLIQEIMDEVKRKIPQKN